ncbi:MAG: HAD hydrolase family protein [Chlamydiota bacterium]
MPTPVFKPSNLILDVDGVLTDGTFLYSEKGKVYKVFGPHDHDGIKLIQAHIPIIFVTADSRGFSITKQRVEGDMKQKLLLLSEKERFSHLMDHYDLPNSIYIGDGIHDAKILRKALFGIAPANSRLEAKMAADYVTPSRGGEGAVLDACLKILETFFVNEFTIIKSDL